MSSQVYHLDTAGKAMSALTSKSMQELGLLETSDLEIWLSGCRSHLFSRNVLWLMRQDRASADQRSDIVGVSDKGDLIIAELKRGTATQDAITQVLAYASEYEPKTPNELAT